MAEACRPALWANADGPDVRRVRVGREVRDLGDGVRDADQLGEAPVRQHVEAHLGHEAADDGEDVRVAGPLAVAVGRALHVRRAGIHGGQGVGHRATRVVLGVDAEPDAGATTYVRHHVVHAHREHAAVGVAENPDVGAGTGRRVQDADAVVGIVPVTVEEVLAVDEDAATVLTQERHGVAHHGEVLLVRGAQGLLDVPDVGLGDEGDDRGLRVDQGADLEVVLHAHTGLAGRAEGHQHRVPQLQLAGRRPREELGVLRHRAGPAALDESHADLVQQARHGELVGDGVRDALALRAVAQRGVEDVEVVGLHEVSCRAGRAKQKTPRGCGGSARRCKAGTDALTDNERAELHGPSVPQRELLRLQVAGAPCSRNNSTRNGWVYGQAFAGIVMSSSGGPVTARCSASTSLIRPWWRDEVVRAADDHDDARRRRTRRTASTSLVVP